MILSSHWMMMNKARNTMTSTRSQSRVPAGKRKALTASPLGTLNHAKSYLRAAEHLCDEIAKRKLKLQFDDPVSLLLGHAVELTLKACLLQKDANDGEFRTHDLNQRRKRAIEAGCRLEADPIEQAHFMLLNGVFGVQPFGVRYLATGSDTCHDDTIVLQIAKRFAEEATAMIPGAVQRVKSRCEVS